MNQRSYYFSGILLILSITWLSYYPALFNGFIEDWDDGSYVLKNPSVQQLSIENIGWMLTAFHAANWHPLTWFSHAVDYALFGEAAWGHHLTSLIFHTLNSVWVFILAIIILYIVEKPVHEKFEYSAIFTQQRFSIAVLTALLFAIHPQHVESVAWVAERKDVLFFFFLIPALLSYVMYTQTRTKTWYINSLLLFFLSLMAKPMAITLPIILMLFDVYPLKQFDIAKPNYKKWIFNKIPFLIIALLSALFTLLAQIDGSAVASMQQVELKVRLLNAINSLIVYIQKWLLPISLSPFYQLEFKHYQSLQNNIVNILAIFMITVVAGYFYWRSYKVWLIAWLFYIITLLPVLGIIQVGSQSMADRYTYLPMLPFYLLLSIGLIKLYFNYSKILSLLLIFVIPMSLIVLTHDQLKIWRSEFTFWGYIVRFNPDSGLAQSHLGSHLIKLGHDERGIQHLEFAVGLSSDWQSQYDLSKAYEKAGRLDDALKQYQIITNRNDIQPNRKAVVYFFVALIYLAKENKTEALIALDKALQLDPEYAEALALKHKLHNL